MTGVLAERRGDGLEKDHKFPDGHWTSLRTLRSTSHKFSPQCTISEEEHVREKDCNDTLHTRQVLTSGHQTSH